MGLTSLHNAYNISHGSQMPKPLLEMLVLASASPRRAEILRSVGWPFTTVAPDIDESRKPGENPVAYVERLALAKAEAAAQTLNSATLVLAADTTVVVGGDILGKPHDDQDASRMLRLLSGRKHEVVTGVALLNSGATCESRVAHQLTRVRFCEISDSELNWYVATGEPMDKAGAYAAQGRAALFIQEIEGDYWNVIGLPVHLAYKLAKEFRQLE